MDWQLKEEIIRLLGEKLKLEIDEDYDPYGGSTRVGIKLKLDGCIISEESFYIRGN